MITEIFVSDYQIVQFDKQNFTFTGAERRPEKSDRIARSTEGRLPLARACTESLLKGLVERSTTPRKIFSGRGVLNALNGVIIIVNKQGSPDKDSPKV